MSCVTSACLPRGGQPSHRRVETGKMINFWSVQAKHRPTISSPVMQTCSTSKPMKRPELSHRRNLSRFSMPVRSKLQNLVPDAFEPNVTTTIHQGYTLTHGSP